MRSLLWSGAFGRDVRHTLRGLRRSPGFAAVAIATLAVAIGANAAIFSVVEALLLRPLPYRDPDRLVVIEATRDITGAARPVQASFRLDGAARWQQALSTLDQIAFYSDEGYELTTRDGSEILRGAIVSPSFFSTLGGAIVAGQPITPANARTASIVISSRLADQRFGGPARAIGERLTLNTAGYTIIGVAGAGWNVPSPKSDIWASTAFVRTIDSRCCGVQLLGRRKPGVSLAQAVGDVRVTAARLASVDRVDFAGLHPTVSSLRDQQLGDARPALLLLWAAVAAVLIIACANLLNLLVARQVSRLREIAIRRALGATRGRLISQGLAESGVLALAGVAGGLLVARVAIAMLTRVDPATFPELRDVHLDVSVAAFALGLGVLTMMATGLLPSIQTARAALPRTPNATPARRHRRLQQGMCAAQLAAAVVLLVSATLFGRSLVGLLNTDLGVSPAHVMTASISAAVGRPHTAPELASTLQRIADRVGRIPGVEAAGVSTSLPPDQSNLIISLGRSSDDIRYVASAVSCTPGYFHALGLRLMAGRLFTVDDDAHHPAVIIVGVTTARHLFGDKDPIGQTFNIPKFPYLLTKSRTATVVGVVSDVKYSGLDAQAGDQVYWPLAQAPWLSTFLAVRAVADANLAPTLRAAVASVDPTVAITSIRPLESILATATAPARFRTTLIVAFAAMALAIAAIGLYGIVAYSVSQRTKEIGVRVALGAETRAVMAAVFREALAIAGAGLAIGLPAAYILARTFAALLYGVKPADAFTYAAATLALLVVALLASYTPARRAARVDPIVALRAE